MTTWVEISKEALIHNLNAFKRLVGPKVALLPAVKGNAYGHGLTMAARIFAENGAPMLGINALYEAETLREAGIGTPLLILGYVPLKDIPRAVELDCRLGVYNPETAEALANLQKPATVHLKVETGTHRQGVHLADLPWWADWFKTHHQITLEGIYSHLADLEDEPEPTYAGFQLDQFRQALKIFEDQGISPPLTHLANTAATILLPESRLSMARPGIGCYGLWPSGLIQDRAKATGVELDLKLALCWKTIVAQVKPAKKGAKIGYGCTHEMKRDGRIAILPVGYYDGYDRSLGSRGAVLVHGKRAPVIGRICMNMMMADVTEIPEVRPEDEVVLIGTQGNETVPADEMAREAGTIHYEMVTRINERIPRILV